MTAVAAPAERAAFEPSVARWHIRIGHVLVRLRYLVMALVAVAAAAPVYHHFSPYPTDFYVFAYAGRAIFGFMPGYHAGALHLYAADPEIQVGPPTLLLAGALEKVLLHQAMLVWSVLIGLCGLGTVRAAELTARARGAAPAVAATGALAGGSIVMAGWSALYQYFHLEDAVAVMCIACAYAVIARGGRWWSAALLLGLASACKPWAIVGLVLVFALPARRRTPALALAVGFAAAWWLPFIIAAPGTVHAVASLPSPVFTTSVWATSHWPHPLAPPGFRLLQLGLAMLLGLWAIIRGRADRAVAVMFAARVLLDPRFYTYYAIGPLAGALIWDLTSRRRLPVWTAFTAVCELAVPVVAPDAVVGWTTAFWSLTLITAALWGPSRPAPVDGEPLTTPATPRQSPLSPMFNPGSRRASA